MLKAAEPLSGAPGGGTGFNASPNSGNDILPLEPLEALRSGQWNWSPVLLGSNHDEAALVLMPALLARGVKLPLSVQAYQFIIANQFGSSAPAVLSEYPAITIATLSSPMQIWQQIDHRWGARFRGYRSRSQL